MSVRCVLGAVCMLAAALYRAPLRQTSVVGDVVSVELGTRPLTNHTRPVTTSNVFNERTNYFRPIETCRTFSHLSSQLVQPLTNLHTHCDRWRVKVTL